MLVELGRKTTNEIENDEDNETDVNNEVIVSLSHIEELKSYLSSKEDSTNYFDYLYKIENHLYLENAKQASIKDYFIN